MALVFLRSLVFNVLFYLVLVTLINHRAPHLGDAARGAVDGRPGGGAA